MLLILPTSPTYDNKYPIILNMVLFSTIVFKKHNKMLIKKLSNVIKVIIRRKKKDRLGHINKKWNKLVH